MFLQGASVRNFRSIESLQLSGCRELNVLIGKNNAGKSNILAAIHAVFNGTKSGRVVVPRPQISHDVNFHGGSRWTAPGQIGEESPIGIAAGNESKPPMRTI
jgi:recombinational DNA repair ATPase RecF